MNRQKLRAALLAWYEAQARDLAWRTGPKARRAGARPDPYYVWLSEVMLQQTTVPHATPYFLKFIRRWPTVDDLAAADDADVMAAWAGLGYYARARNLLACARVVSRELRGAFPTAEAELRALPGLGAYTAAALAAIAFDQPANVVDGNVERVVARIHAVETPLPAAKPVLTRLAGDLATAERPGDWAQALMDLGATICKPKSPLCDVCPINTWCQAHRLGSPAQYPRKTRKASRPRRYGIAYLLKRGEQIALVPRPPMGLLGGMLGLPTSEWRDTPWSEAEALSVAPIVAAWLRVGEIEHVFTHFALTLTVFAAEGCLTNAVWTGPDELGALPSVFLKAARA